MIARGLASTDHVVLAHLIPMRRCNLSCTYCNEYDKVSNPVSVPEMRRRIDHLKRLGTNVVTISGGEPLMHPELDDVIRYIRSRGIIAGLITNGYLLTQKRIELLTELVPQAKVIGLLVNPKNPTNETTIGDPRQAARTKGVQIEILEARADLCCAESGMLILGSRF